MRPCSKPRARAARGMDEGLPGTITPAPRSLIEEQEGLSIKFIFKNKGENHFRKIENELTMSELKKENTVISLGGGAFLNNAIRKSVKKLCISFWLDVPLDELIKRLRKNRQRPLLLNQNTDEVVKKIY